MVELATNSRESIPAEVILKHENQKIRTPRLLSFQNTPEGSQFSFGEIERGVQLLRMRPPAKYQRCEPAEIDNNLILMVVHIKTVPGGKTITTRTALAYRSHLERLSAYLGTTPESAGSLRAFLELADDERRAILEKFLEQDPLGASRKMPLKAAVGRLLKVRSYLQDLDETSRIAVCDKTDLPISATLGILSESSAPSK